MGFRTSEPKRELKFTISKQHCSTAKRKDPCECVIAKALHEKYGKELSCIHVLSHITTLAFTDGRLHRYKTPPELRKALAGFDASGRWDLSFGEYHLDPLPRSLTKKAQAKRAAERRKNGDKNMERKQREATGKRTPRKLNFRMITLREMPKSN